MSNSLSNLKKEVSKAVFGVEDVADYISRNICICCNQPDALSRCHTEYGAKDFSIMGICEQCYDKMFIDSGDDEGEESLERGANGRYADEMPERDFYEGDSPDY